MARWFFKQNPKNLGRTDVSDLFKDPVIVWQHNHYTLAPPESIGKSSRRHHLVLFGHGRHAMIGWLRQIIRACHLVAIM
jgi:hypothetical protein